MRKTRRVEYTALPTLARFHASDAFVRGVMGPVGSGKSTAMCMELMRRAREQAPGPDGVRRTRFAVIRNTVRELRDTALRTWLDWFPPDLFGPFLKTEMIHRVRQDGVECDVLFRALDSPADVKKLLSLELTGAWVNEARELPKAVVDALADRVGRFPSRREGGATWAGLILDTNPPDTDHWWYRLAEIERPRGWEFLRQPGGLLESKGTFAPNPAAENLANLPPGYYARAASGRSPDHVRVYHCAQYGFTCDGRPVFPEYADAVHCAPEPLEPVGGVPLVVGLDFGLTPAALVAQRAPNGRWLWLDELVAEDMGVARFGRLLLDLLHGRYSGFSVDVWGDPAGAARSQTDERTAFQVLHALGVDARPAPSNDFTLRREAIAAPLSRLVDGKPGLLVSPRCATARRGLAGGYSLRRLALAGTERFADKPDKNRFSHVLDAAGYALLGAGEGRALTRPRAAPGARQERADYRFRLGGGERRDAARPREA
ncbi:MAG: hypothetical protein AB1916_07410 [Thermodesulfobacteriota bacterium]